MRTVDVPSGATSLTVTVQVPSVPVLATYSRRFAEPLICTGSVTAAVVKLSPPRSWNDESAKNFGPSAMAAPAVTWAISRDTSPRISAWTPSADLVRAVRTATLLDGQTAVMSTVGCRSRRLGAQVETLSRHTGPRELSARGPPAAALLLQRHRTVLLDTVVDVPSQWSEPGALQHIHARRANAPPCPVPTSRW